jgi:acetyl esterase/lipase
VNDHKPNDRHSRPSIQSRLVAAAIRLIVRRERWGDDRALARRARRLFGAPPVYGWLRSHGVRIRPSTHPQIPGEWLHSRRDTGRVTLYVHGGGFVSCSAATHRPITSQLARSTGCVFAVNYPLAPESRYPAAPDAVLAAYRWLLDEVVSPNHLAVIGDSAGGNLAVGLLLRVRDAGLPLPACAVALSPWLDLSGSLPSVQANNGRCAMFRPGNMTDFARAYLGTGTEPEDWAFPLRCDLNGLPPLLLQVGSDELLLDDALQLHSKLRSRGGDSALEIYDGVFHGWHLLDGIMPEASTALNRVASFLDAHLCAAGVA